MSDVPRLVYKLGIVGGKPVPTGVELGIPADSTSMSKELGKGGSGGNSRRLTSSKLGRGGKAQYVVSGLVSAGGSDCPAMKSGKRGKLSGRGRDSVPTSYALGRPVSCKGVGSDDGSLRKSGKARQINSSPPIS